MLVLPCRDTPHGWSRPGRDGGQSLRVHEAGLEVVIAEAELLEKPELKDGMTIQCT